MSDDDRNVEAQPVPYEKSRRIVDVVSLCSIALFAVLATQAIPTVADFAAVTRSDGVSAVPLLLSIALTGQEAGETFFGLPVEALPGVPLDKIVTLSEPRRSNRRRSAV